MPLPSTRVIHPDWAARHMPVVAGTMNATCVITHGHTGGGWDPTTGPTPGTPTTTYTGPCRVQYAGTAPREADAAGELVTTRSVLVVIPRDLDGVPVPVQSSGARVKITAVDANGPVGLIGQTLTVGAVNLSSLAWEQDLTCTDDQTTPEA